ncbi:MAG: LuxR C-terminal-related transcriptional regulator [Chloroflexi bacterium]|nr:LuxR C-terminal-related transcriptional regulator [Chloroflexota bacterium]
MPPVAGVGARAAGSISFRAKGTGLAGSMTVDTLLATKLLLPTTRPDLVARPRLVARLEEGLRLGRRLTLVSAPPGFGKTTLIREWIGAVERPVAWLALDEDDNDAVRFLRYLIAALDHRSYIVAQRSVVGNPPAETEKAPQGLRQVAEATFQLQTGGFQPLGLQAPPAASPQEMLIALINDLARAGTDVLLVLDDYHVIREFAVHDLVAFLLAHQPPGFHVVIGTREDPPLPLARLRARDQVTEIREGALRFTPEEAAAFLTQTMRLGLSPAAITSLAARTEGWITGLQLAGLALRQSTGGLRLQAAADAFVAAFAGDDRYVVDYLMAEVLDRAPEPLRAFLRQTSVLDRLSAPLCDALTGRDDSQAMLEQLEAANLFLTCLDNRREWYRYHVLFAEVLRLTLTPAERSELHKKAARWFQANGWGELAVHHARLTAETPPATGTAGRHALSQPLVEPLSEREIEVLRLIAEGYANAEIAGKLYIATGTVKRHINNIYGKLDAASRTQAIAKGRALGLLE